MDIDLFHYWAQWRTFTAHMGIEGNVPYTEGDFIEVGFDGEFYDFNVFEKNSPIEVVKVFQNKNVYRFILGDMTLINDEYWVLTFIAKFHGSNWHGPKLQWIQLCPDTTGPQATGR